MQSTSNRCGITEQDVRHLDDLYERLVIERGHFIG